MLFIRWLRSAFIADAMNALRRGLTGAMFGAVVVGVIAAFESFSGDVAWETFFVLAALVGLLAASFGGSALSSRRGMKRLAVIGAVAGFALLASPIAAMALHNWKIELSGLAYLMPVCAGLFGGVLAVVNEVGRTTRSAHRDIENHGSEGKRRRIWPSLLGAGILLLFDVVFEGSYLLSILACPVWFLMSVVKNVIVRPGWRLALSRVAIPVLTLGIVLANTALQWKIADANGEQVAKACEDFHAASGHYPKTLDELVPRYLPSAPRAKYCLRGEFLYVNLDGQDVLLGWHKIGFCRKIYDFQTKEWHHLD